MKKSNQMVEQIRILKGAGHSIRAIAKVLRISRNTVRRYLRDGADEGTPDAARTEEPASPTAQPPPDWHAQFPWDAVCRERKAGASAMVLYREHEPPVSYSRFCRTLRAKLTPSVSTALRLSHNAGERTQIDFCDGLRIVEPKTGDERRTHFFCGVLPFSSLIYGEFVFDQKLPSFIRAQERMWHYFGGVTKYVVVDNLKSAVKKAHRYDPDLNPTYVDYADHAGFAALAARPYTPRDKAAVESAIGIMQRTFFQTYRNHKFYSLAELNACFREFLNDFNRQPMREFGVSRLERFQAEAPHLASLPSSPYEISEWRQAKVHPDCCIQVLKSVYSVPFRYIGQTVRVKVSPGLVEVFSEDTEKVACHKRATKQGSCIIDEQHLPPTRMQESSFELRKVRAKAASVGPKTRELVESELEGDRPLRHLRRVQGILRLLDQGIPPESLEYGCAQALTFKRHRVAYIKSCALHHKSNGGRLRLDVPVREPETLHLHGESHVRLDSSHRP